LFDRGGDDVVDVFAPGLGCDQKRSDLRGVTASDFLVEVRQHDVDALLREPRAGRLPTPLAPAVYGDLAVDVRRWSFPDASATARQGWCFPPPRCAREHTGRSLVGLRSIPGA
jgi:hypothetical protein